MNLFRIQEIMGFYVIELMLSNSNYYYSTDAVIANILDLKRSEYIHILRKHGGENISYDKIGFRTKQLAISAIEELELYLIMVKLRN